VQIKRKYEHDNIFMIFIHYIFIPIANNLMSAFTNYSRKLNISSLNGIAFSCVYGFGMMVDFNSSYYVLEHWKHHIFLLNDNYAYVTMETFTAPNYMITVNSSLYVTGDHNIWKTDKYLNKLITYDCPIAWYRGIYFNSTENLIYAARSSLTYFELFDLNLNFLSTVSISPYKPFSFSEFNNELYIGTSRSSVIVVVNKIIIRIFPSCSTVSSIVFDDCGLMATSCFIFNYNDLYYSNETYANKSLITPPGYPVYVGFDSKGRYVQISTEQISIFY
jgi:hypothetical protein